MNVLYYDCFAGISGDMNLAAMIDLGVDPEFLQKELSLLKIDEEFSLEISRSNKMGIEGTRVTVHLHQHEEHSHCHHHEGQSGHHHHRNVESIERIIDGSELSPDVKKAAKKIFMEVAVAEAKVHGKPLGEIHFHEVGATDSIVDIVGAAICYHKLGVDKVMSRPVELGGGFVRCQHGMMPVPAPATAEIVSNIPCTFGAVNHEATTPTGAAILKVLVDEFTTTPQLTIKQTAYGIGHRDCAIPNVLRVYLTDE